MIYKSESDFFQKILLLATGKIHEVRHVYFISGGFVNQSVKVDTDSAKFFIKFNETKSGLMFTSEATSLKFLKSKLKSVIIPDVIFFGEESGRQVIVQEFIQEKAILRPFWKNLANTIVELHQIQHDKAGLHFNNFISSLKQQNEQTDKWVQFFFEQRLSVQFGLAYYNGIIEKSLFAKLDKLQLAFEKLYEPEAFSLLHGNLRKENVYTTLNNQVCMVNPSIYFGNREVDIANAKLFGGFDESFFRNYQAIYPLLPGNLERMEIYSLYPLMLYVNLYNSESYIKHINKIIDKYI
ncbi:fructosamine kinase family protein [Chondrinema litorale]|uniref:fructosamine kinase family protein n=1 Tax=Chondrinema litorale TaxID=2994555 RepID=UPI002542AAC8|nr:fructosamine kinase family protein [Chondrinema litorale]UZR95716.1 fructosamine kinase family protein [Chondrinema litorale]